MSIQQRLHVKKTDLFDRCMTLNFIYMSERLNVQFFLDGSAGVRCITVRIIDIYTYIDSLGFFMDQMPATGPRCRQQNLIKSL